MKIRKEAFQLDRMTLLWSAASSEEYRFLAHLQSKSKIYLEENSQG